jgi:peptidyl-dipeptidase Dcp
MTNNPENPLLKPSFGTPFEAPPFHQIRLEHYLPAFEEAIRTAREEIAALRSQPEPPDFENTIEALEQVGLLVNRASEIFFNLNQSETSDEMQQLAQQISPLLTEYHNDVLLDAALFARIKAVYDQRNALSLQTEQQTLLEKTYKSFVRNGALLDAAGKNRLREIDKELARLSLTFGENLLKETNRYLMVITDEQELAGLPDFAKEAALETAREKGVEQGWAVTLDAPSYIPFMTYAESRSRREELFQAYASRCFKGDELDNQENVRQIAGLRHERANLLGYESHAHFVLEERMASSPQRVREFLENLLGYARPAADKDIETLAAFAKSLGGPEVLQRWDYAYYAEKLKKEKFQIDDALLKPYFKLEFVIDGIFTIARKLYGLVFEENQDIPVYHPDVKTYEISDVEGKHVGVLYADFFPRATKRNGAWMTSFRGQKKHKGVDTRPLISIVCNFTKPTASKPSLLTFDEVTTFFHEFGHALHGMLANGQYESLSGTNVYWDFVELPSQIMENWAYEKECLDLFARHYQTQEPIPVEMVERIRQAANFMSGYSTLRQLSFGLLDMAWHQGAPDPGKSLKAFETEVLAPTELFPPVESSSISCAFGHIFQGGYAAGYYSYKWAEVLDADAFEYFLETGIFNPETAWKFKEYILSAGGREHPMQLYVQFRGKEPSPEALLKRSGLLATS